MLRSDWFFRRSETRVLLALSWLAVAAQGCGHPSVSTGTVAHQRFTTLYEPLADRVEQRMLSGNGFRHRVFTSAGFDQRPTNGTLVVLFHGDGEPVDRRGRVRSDPGPFHSLLLDSSVALNAPWVMVGRPCYFATNDSACRPELWTRDRYHRDLAVSMAAVLDELVTEEERVVFVAYSGGAVFAYALAEYFPQLDELLVLAGNMNVQAWVQGHGFSVMGEGSIDPARLGTLPCRIRQIYVAGNADRNIEWQWLQAFALAQQKSCGTVEFHLLPQATHTTGWRSWPEYLRTLR